ncbi:MAG: hypothetical protein JWO87_2349 [Phycisphaerales bacterium]|nr:hypothetical protein [Phycisphaerales bacterium]
MATQWRMKGAYFKNCNCDPGCPCDFWAAPTHTHCEGMLGMHIDEGRFGDTPLSGLNFAATYYFPGPLHLGNGSLQPFVDQRADAKQREALLTIMSGQAGNAWFQVVASLITTMHAPKFVPIAWEFDMSRLHAKLSIPGELETESSPVKDLASGNVHQARVVLPKGMEYRECSVATTKVLKATGKIQFDCPPGNASLAFVEHTQDGLIA